MPDANNNPIAERSLRLICKRTGINKNKIDPQVDFEDIGMDSLDMVELMIEIESEFKINIPDEIAEKLTSPAKVFAFVELALKTEKPKQSRMAA